MSLESSSEPSAPTLRPVGEPARSPEELLDRFMAWVESKGLTLYPAQEEALFEISLNHNVILNTPTGSGKSLVGLAACFAASEAGGRAFYTAPIKALVGEKFLELCRAFGPENVGMMTGDASVNRDAPILACTAEILANVALREGAAADVDWVVMDEFHYYSDRDRGVAWQLPLLCLPQARFLLMSATLGDTKFFVDELTERTGAETALVQSRERPVPLDYRYAETPLHETVSDLLADGHSPIYIVHFSQAAACEQAQRLTSLDFLTKEQKATLREELKGVRFDSPFGKDLLRYIPHGIGVHHAGLLPKYRLLVERLAQRGLLKVICGTDTLGVGVNIPLRTVLFTQLCKYDGDKVKLLSVRDFHQIAGRAGRRGFDTQGSVVVQAPEHVIENLQAARKAAADPKKAKKFHPKKPPETGFAPWDAKTLEQLRTGEPEQLVSRFRVSHGMMLQVLGRKEESGCKALKRLLRDNFEPKPRQKRHQKEALALFSALARAKIVELIPGGVRVHEDLQADFSLDHALSLFAVEVVESLDREAQDYPLVVLSTIEAIVENPGLILKKQLDKLKAAKLAELKAKGVEYEERMEELAKLTWPQPEAEFLNAVFADFESRHPWVRGDTLCPKSIVRDWYEQGLTFNGYVKEYGLERTEGVLLRYVSECYRALCRSVPESCRTEALDDVIDWLGAEVRAVDASLLEEWQRLMDPDKVREMVEQNERSLEVDLLSDKPAFRRLVQTEVFRWVQRIARQDYRGLAESLKLIAAVKSPTEAELVSMFAPYFEEFPELVIDQRARAKQHFSFDRREDESVWPGEQTLFDPEEEFAYRLQFEVDSAASRQCGKPVLRLLGLRAD